MHRPSPGKSMDSQGWKLRERPVRGDAKGKPSMVSPGSEETRVGFEPGVGDEG